MNRSLERHSVAIPALLLLCGPAAASAQAPAYFAALTVPPASGGTCSATQSTAASGRQVITHRIIIKSVRPGSDRELVVYADPATHARIYSEETSTFSPPTASASTSVLAAIKADGSVKGTLVRQSITMTPPPAGGRLDAAALRRMREQARRSSTRSDLDATQQAQVRRLAEWLVRRCRLSGGRREPGN